MLSEDPSNLANLPSKTLLSTIQTIDIDKFRFSGYFEIKVDGDRRVPVSEIWHLFFSRGKIVFSGCEAPNFTNVFKALENYLPALRNNKLISPEVIAEINNRSQTNESILMIGLLGELALRDKALNYEQFTKAIQSHIIADAEDYLFHNVINFRFVSSKKIDYLRPIVGLTIEQFLSVATLRSSQWQKINNIIPSLSYEVRCNTSSPQWQQLALAEKIKIRKLVGVGNTLESIRYTLGEDSLEVAQIFGRLVTNQLVTIEKNTNSLPAKHTLQSTPKISEYLEPKITIIDDSQVLLKQFSAVVKTLGYQVSCCDDALKAVDILLEYEPEIIFVDINMPELSGFQLIKQIRTQPKLSLIPLVILTAEKTMMNQQRAKWSKSKFLSKPLDSEDSKRFAIELKSMLNELAPISSP